MLSLHRRKDMSDPHTMLGPLAESRNWVFVVGGDEIYNPDGLVRFRDKSISRALDSWWVVLGNVLNCTAFDKNGKSADGTWYLPVAA